MSGNGRVQVVVETIPMTPDPVVNRVIVKHAERVDRGVAKYGTTLAGNLAPLKDRLRHMQEEQMDAAAYSEWAIEEVGRMESEIERLRDVEALNRTLETRLERLRQHNEQMARELASRASDPGGGLTASAFVSTDEHAAEHRPSLVHCPLCTKWAKCDEPVYHEGPACTVEGRRS